MLTLGDVLFASGNLNKLVAFLQKHPTRTAAIEGYMDSLYNPT